MNAWQQDVKRLIQADDYATLVRKLENANNALRVGTMDATTRRYLGDAADVIAMELYERGKVTSAGCAER